MASLRHHCICSERDNKHCRREFDAWPPPAASPHTLSLCAGGALELAPTASSSDEISKERSAGSFDEWLSDPGRPVPYTADISVGMTREHMTDDQVR